MTLPVKTPTLPDPPDDYSKDWARELLRHLENYMRLVNTPGALRGSTLNLSRVPETGVDLPDGDVFVINGFLKLSPADDSEAGTGGGGGGDTIILYGAGVPGGGTGDDGDFYIKTASPKTFYGPKASGAWPAGVSMEGTNGTNGTDGDDGTDGADGVPAPFEGARIVPSALQNYTTISAWDTVRFASAERDTGGFWSAGSPHRLTVPSGVSKVRLVASLKVDSTDTLENHEFAFAKNGTVSAPAGLASMGMGGNGYNNPGATMESDVLDVSPGDYFEVYYYASGTFSLNADRGQTWFAMQVVEQVYVGLAMDDLNDADTTSTPPVDGDSLVWDEAAGNWVPGVPNVLYNEAAGLNKPFEGALAKFTANKVLTVPTSPIIWDDVDYDEAGAWSAGQPGRLTVPAGTAKIRLHGCIVPSSALVNGASFSLQFLKNGSGFRGNSPSGGQVGHTDVGTAIHSPALPVTPGDYFELRVDYSGAGTFTAHTNSYFALEVVEYLS